MRLKVEINTREHFAVYGFKRVTFAVSSRWFDNSCEIFTYELDELLGTKLRALYQRKKGRDLFDLATAMTDAGVNSNRIVEAFSEYMAHEGQRATRAQFERNIDAKLHDPQFAADISPLLSEGYAWNLEEAAERVSTGLVQLLSGDPWKGEG